MSQQDSTDPYHMAALKKKKVAAQTDLLTAGEGTPWEDRGRIGIFAAFFKTCIMSMTSPAKLMNSMRRPEVSSDLTSFSVGCGFMWALTVLIHSVFYYVQLNHQAAANAIIFYPNQFWLNAAVQAVAVCVGTWVILKVVSSFYLKIIAHDLTRTPPTTLVFNAMAYGLGPSLLAPIPFAGPPLAAIWIFVNWIIVGSRRLHAKTSSAIIATVLTSVAIPVVVLAIWYFGGLVATNTLGWQSVDAPPPVTTPGHFGG